MREAYRPVAVTVAMAAATALLAPLPGAAAGPRPGAATSAVAGSAVAAAPALVAAPAPAATAMTAAAATAATAPASGTPATVPAAPALHDGSHDFDFIIGDWKAHVKRLPDRLVGSNKWIEYDGISNHKKLLDSNANFEEFDVRSKDGTLRIKAQTLRLYNPETHQWSIYLVDLDKGTLGLPPVIGQFTGKHGEFFDQEDWKGRAVYIRFAWTDISPHSAHMEQSFSADGGKTWEVNWICDLSR